MRDVENSVTERTDLMHEGYGPETSEKDNSRQVFDQRDSGQTHQPLQRLFYRHTVRLFNVVLAVSFLLPSLLIILILAVLVRFGSSGTIFFRQTRVGRFGKLFTIYKIRSMHCDTPTYADSPYDDWCDDRVTRLGRMIRASGLDELPQLLCVLKGDMNFVGPRPEMRQIVDRYDDRQRRRLEVLPGITGPWQLSPMRDQPIHDNLQFDRYYLIHRSYSLDIQCIVRTLFLFFRRLVGLCLMPFERDRTTFNRVDEPSLHAEQSGEQDVTWEDYHTKPK